MSEKDKEAISAAFADMAMHGRGFTRMTADGIDHVPYHDLFMKLTPLKAEGMPVHPDTFCWNGTDEAYLLRLQAYADWRGIEETKRTECSKPEMLERLK